MDRAEVNAVLREINHEPTFTCIRAERELQRLLSGDCSLPVGVRTTLRGDSIEMRAILFGTDSQPPAEAHSIGLASDPESVARAVMDQLNAASGA